MQLRVAQGGRRGYRTIDEPLDLASEIERPVGVIGKLGWIDGFRVARAVVPLIPDGKDARLAGAILECLVENVDARVDDADDRGVTPLRLASL